MNIFDPLIYKKNVTDTDGISGLCESWTIIDDRTIEFKLNKGITFHNGVELTSKDVEFTFERAMLSDDSAYFHPTLTSILPYFEDVEVIDDYTFRINSNNPDPALIERLSSVMGFYIVPKDYIEEIGREAFGLAPVGTGPYKVIEFTPDKLILEYYEGFYGERPAADRIEFYCYPEVSTRMTALFNNEVDIATSLNPENVATIEDRGYQADSVVIDWCYMLNYNCSQEPMDDPLLREAMNISIDRQALADYIWCGTASVSNSYNFPGYGDYYIEDYPDYEYNPERAKELLAQSTYAGELINYEVRSGYYTLGDEVAEAICAMWQAIGINAQVKFNDVWDDSAYQVHNNSNSPRFMDPAGGLWLLWGDGTACQKYFWQNKETWDEYAAQAAILLQSSDFNERYEANKRMMDLWEQELVGTVLFNISEITGVRPGLSFERTSSPHIDFRADSLSVVE